MSMQTDTHCAVRGCTQERAPDLNTCFRCNTMLATGRLMPSHAWFAVELEYLMQQNEALAEHVRKLNERIDEAKVRIPRDVHDVETAVDRIAGAVADCRR